MALSAVYLLAPEIGLVAVILLILSADLFGKRDPSALIEGSIISSLLIFAVLFFLWPTSGEALHGMFQLNPLAIFLKGIFLGSCTLTLWMARELSETFKNRLSDFALLILMATLGAFFLASANDLITLFITIEWITISLYVLTAYLKTDKYALEAGTKYLIMGAFSSAFFLYGISLVYGTAGSIHFDHVREWLLHHPPTPLFLVGFLLILSGIGFKIAAFPFQLWVPDVYQGAPTPVTAFLSVTSKTAGFAALLKVLFLVTGPDRLNWTFLLSLLSALTLTYGNLGALGQTNMKRLFAYSSIGHAGYLLMGIASGVRFGIEATLFYLAAYAISNLTAFLVIVIVNRELGSGEIVDYRGLAKKEPFIAGVFFVALLSLSGIPPLVGFFGKFLVLQAAVVRGYLWLALLGAVNVIISLYYYLSIIKEMYFKQGEGEIKIGGATRVLLFFLALGIIGLGIFQEPILYLAKSSALTLF